MTKLEHAVVEWFDACQELTELTDSTDKAIARLQSRLKSAKEREAQCAREVRAIADKLKTVADRETIATEMIKQLAEKVSGAERGPSEPSE